MTSWETNFILGVFAAGVVSGVVGFAILQSIIYP